MLQALLHRRQGERPLVVMDSEYIFKGITQWSAKWWRHAWRTASGQVGHRDLWEQILWERRSGLGSKSSYGGYRRISGCQGIMGGRASGGGQAAAPE